jgi:hypothetical protein
MIKILRRISEYTLDEFKQYCENNGIDHTQYSFNVWAIAKHDIDLNRFIQLAGPNTIITVSGVVCLDKKSHKVKDRTLTLSEAFDAMVTPDAQDYCVVLSPQGKYYVIVLHARGHNMFKFSLNNDKK